jgi:hypothetical protein
VWLRRENKKSVRYFVDRSHPVVRSLLLSGCQHQALLESVIRLIESTFPIASILQEPAKALDGVPEAAPAALEELVKPLLFAEEFLIRTGKSPEEARRIVLLAEPFAEHRDAIEEYLRR